MPTYEAWDDPSENSITLTTSAGIAASRAKGLLSDSATLLYRFDAETWEEASAIHALRMGWSAYKPIGPAAPCPNCGAKYYPSDSAQCWHCHLNVPPA